MSAASTVGVPDETVDHLTTALADRNRIERELGEGGMATVHLAEDLKHHREVALKVLRPELAAVKGAERRTFELQQACVGCVGRAVSFGEVRKWWPLIRPDSRPRGQRAKGAG